MAGSHFRKRLILPSSAARKSHGALPQPMSSVVFISAEFVPPPLPEPLSAIAPPLSVVAAASVATGVNPSAVFAVEGANVEAVEAVEAALSAELMTMPPSGRAVVVMTPKGGGVV